MKYAIEAETLEHAMDEIVMNEHNHQFEEFTQRWLGEQIIDGQEVTHEELVAMINKMSTDKDEMCSHWMGDKLIHKVNYENSGSK